jgi:hypothetical protein
MRPIRIVEQNPQPAPKPPIPGCAVSLKFSSQSAQVARYETMAMPRPIEIKSGRVVIFARPGVPATASAVKLESPRPDDDESALEILSLTPHAHTVTVSGSFSGGKQKSATFGGIGASLKLIALAGMWHVAGAHNVKLA